MKFQDKFYDIFDHNKCPPSETEDEKCNVRKSYFHRIQPRYTRKSKCDQGERHNGLKKICHGSFEGVMAQNRCL